MINLLVARTIMILKFANNAFLSFNLMIDLLAAGAIMRSKLKKALLVNFNCMKNPVDQGIESLLQILIS
jgi:hypothetical protein